MTVSLTGEYFLYPRNLVKHHTRQFVPNILVEENFWKTQKLTTSR